MNPLRTLIIATLLASFALLSIAPALAAEVERSLPASAEQGELIAISLVARGATPGQSVVIGEMLPEGAALEGWAASGASGVRFTQEGQSLVWEFTAESVAPSISYTVVLPEGGTGAVFDAVYAIAPEGFGNTKSSLTLVPPAAPEALPPAFVPVSVEQPAPVAGMPSALLAALVLIIAAFGMGLYLWKRVHDAPHHRHVSVTEVLGIATRIGALRTRMELTRPDVPEGYVVVPGGALERLEERQRKMVAQVEAYEGKVLLGDTNTLSELEHLKQELLSIRFSYHEA